MKYNVVVTQEDIDADGHRANNCPVYRALARELGRDDVRVGFAILWMPYISWSRPLPTDVRRWIAQYDYRGPIARDVGMKGDTNLPLKLPSEPFSFEIEIDDLPVFDEPSN